MQRSKLTYLSLLPIFGLTACFETDLQKCEALFNDENKRPLSVAYCEKAALLGEAKAQFIYSQLLFDDNKPEQAVIFLERSANQKNASALFELGQRYESGQGLESNLEKAKFYYEQSCAHSEIKGCERVAMFEKTQKTQIEQQKLSEERQKLEEQKQALEAERTKREKQLAEEKRLLEERRKFEEEKATAEKQLLAERQRLQMAATQSSQNMQNSYRERRSTDGTTFYGGLGVFKQDGLYGFIDYDGYVVIPAQFAYAGRFSRERSAVQDPHTQLWGFIDTKGNYIVRPKYCTLGAFSESDGLAGVYNNGYKVGDKCEGGKWGFMDTSGNWVVDPVLDYAERFIKGKAKVVYKGTEGFINRYGQWVTE